MCTEVVSEHDIHIRRCLGKLKQANGGHGSEGAHWGAEGLTTQKLVLEQADTTLLKTGYLAANTSSANTVGAELELHQALHNFQQTHPAHEAACLTALKRSFATRLEAEVCSAMKRQAISQKKLLKDAWKTFEESMQRYKLSMDDLAVHPELIKLAKKCR